MHTFRKFQLAAKCRPTNKNVFESLETFFHVHFHCNASKWYLGLNNIRPTFLFKCPTSRRGHGTTYKRQNSIYVYLSVYVCCPSLSRVVYTSWSLLNEDRIEPPMWTMCWQDVSLCTLGKVDCPPCVRSKSGSKRNRSTKNVCVCLCILVAG